MKFEEVLPALKEGKKIRRTFWSPSHYIELNGTLFYDNVTCKDYNFNRYDFTCDNWEIYQEPLLTDKEKEYLKNLVTPFKDIVISITKFMITGEYSTIQIDTVNIIERNKYCIINLPYFKTTEHFLHMEIGKKYTLDDLDLL